MASKRIPLEKIEHLLDVVKDISGTQNCQHQLLEDLNNMFRLAFPKSAKLRPYRKGYIEWNDLEKHNMKKLSGFILFCGAVERDEGISIIGFYPDIAQNEVVNQNTRFPNDVEEGQEEELYVDVSSPLVKAQMLYISELLKDPNKNCRDGLTKNFLNFVKDDIYTRSSFEKKHGLTWSKQAF